MKTFAVQNIYNVIEQMRYEYDKLLYGEEYDNRMSRIEECAREIIDLVEKANG